MIGYIIGWIGVGFGLFVAMIITFAILRFQPLTALCIFVTARCHCVCGVAGKVLSSLIYYLPCCHLCGEQFPMAEGIYPNASPSLGGAQEYSVFYLEPLAYKSHLGVV